MKNRKCRMTPQQKDMHNQAVKLRNMTDEKLIEYIDHVRADAEQLGYERGQSEKSSGAVSIFLDELNDIRGIGTVTLAKLRRFAVEAGYVSREEVAI